MTSHGSHHPRDKDGFVTTWENQAGELLTVHRKGRPTATLAEVADAVTARDPSFRLVCYSTPDTILRDLAGGNRISFEHPTTKVLHLPERNVLSRIGRADLLHPRLRSRSTSDADRRRVYGP